MRITKRPHRRAAARRERGLALVMALFAIGTLLLVAAAGLSIGSAGIEATRNYRGATQVHMVAEAAISEALQVINGPGVVNFQNDVVSPWGGLYGTSPKNFAPHSGFTYYVQPAALGTDPANRGRLVATANGKEGVKNVVVASVQRSDIPSTAPGAIYLASDTSTNASFSGDAFKVDGNDHNYTGGYGPNPPVPGISTRNDTNTQEAINSLNSQQKDDVTGFGYSAGPPIVPSVSTSPAAPTAAQLSQIIDDLLARGPAWVDTYSDTNINGMATFGTTANPRITYFNNASGVTIKGNGNADGAGIWIVEGDLTIQGTLDFKGLVLVRGKTRVEADTEVTGNATVYGSIWTSDVNLSVGGSAIVYYSTQALALANNVAGGAALPSPVKVTQLADCALVTAGTGGCP
jgi:hypothetical protein